MTIHRKKPIIPAAILRELSVRASVDPRTLRRYVAGDAVSMLPCMRIEQALREQGLEHLIRSRTSSPPPVAA